MEDWLWLERWRIVVDIVAQLQELEIVNAIESDNGLGAG